MTNAVRGASRSDVARCWAGFASLGAGLVHFGVVREHLDSWLLHGMFFAALGSAQIAWALLAMSRDRVPLPRLVVTATLSLVALWAFTRTFGLPFGPGAGTPEPVGTADLLAMVLHGMLVASVVVAVRSDRSAHAYAARPRTAGRTLVGLGAGALVMAALTTPALAATEAGATARPHFSISGH